MWSYRLHATDALIYACLQRGQGRAAKRVLDGLQTVQLLEVKGLTAAYTVAAIPACYAFYNSHVISLQLRKDLLHREAQLR
jgi:hypothetical protein